MITFNHVTFGYGSGNTIHDMSFHIGKGEFAAVIGANGAGKSTLCRLCNGLLKPSAGSVNVVGCDTQKTKASRIAKSIGFLFQNPDRQICQNTIRKEILFGLACVMDDGAGMEKRCSEILEIFGFDGSRDPFTMSRGERQRIALASLIARRPEILILDEPTTGLDYRECMQIMGLIRKLNEEGMTIIMVSHDMELVLNFARRVIVVRDGRLAGDGLARELLADRELLASASVLPPQIADLALRLGEGFENVFTVEEMCHAIGERRRG